MTKPTPDNEASRRPAFLRQELIVILQKIHIKQIPAYHTGDYGYRYGYPLKRLKPTPRRLSILLIGVMKILAFFKVTGGRVCKIQLLIALLIKCAYVQASVEPFIIPLVGAVKEFVYLIGRNLL